MAQPLTPLVSDGVTPGVSLPARDIPSVNPFSAWQPRPEDRPLKNRGADKPRAPFEIGIDPVVQRATAAAAMPPVITSFEGMNIDTSCGNCLPPDTVGAVGPNHYVQMVNSHFQIFNKSGATLVPPKPINSLWSTKPGTTCFTHNNGDPIVIYDQLADRWLLSQFTVQTGSEPYAECIAISKTPDPTGAYWLYQFDQSTSVFHDYPHIAMWPDAYYMTTNLFPNDALLTSTGAGVWAFEREKMLAGQTARFVYFDLTPLATESYTPGGQLPANLDGFILPPAGAPGLIVEVNDSNVPPSPPATEIKDQMFVWRFHVDWTNPALSTFGVGSSAPAPHPTIAGQFAGEAGDPNFTVPVANFIQNQCFIENSADDCAPQRFTAPNVPQYLDVLGDRLMFRVVYRNFADHEALLVQHSADVAPADSSDGVGRIGIRWYEVRNVASTPTVFQQGTFGPFDPASADGPLWRWMGSIAMDRVGNIAAGYSASGPNYYPSLHYAGRLAADPLNQLAQGEAVLFPGQGVEIQIGIFPFRNRWGDYSNMVVDPTDDCTFWYTTEYAKSTPSDILVAQWMTRIGSFKFPQCVPSQLQLVSAASRKVHGTVPFDIPLPQTSPRGVECRTGGAAGEYTIVFRFANPISSCGSVSGANGTASVGSDTSECLVQLSGVPNAQYTTVTLNNVVDQQSNTGSVSATVGVLVGDTTGNGAVNSSDISQTKSQSGQTVTSGNFRTDVTVNGSINSSDISLVKSKSGTALP